MMRHFHSLVLAAAFVAVPGLAAAQRSGPEFNLGIGPTFPTGDLANRNPVGYNLTAGMGVTPSASSLGFRVEGLYDAFNGKHNYIVVCTGAAGCGRQSWVSGLTLNLTYSRLLPRHARRRRAPATLYAIGGYGFYTVHLPTESGPTPGGVVGFDLRDRALTGWNVGGGIRFPVGNVSAYVEARVHTMTQTGTRIVPVSFGLIF